jgi:hypothetical protein
LASKRDKNSVTRTIQHFSFKAWDKDNHNHSFKELREIFSKIKEYEELPIPEEPTLNCGFVEYGDVSLCMRKISLYDNSIFGWLGYTRSNNLPLKIEGKGETNAFQLESGSFIFEPTSFIIYSNGAALMEWNQLGPRHAALAFFLRNISPLCEKTRPVNGAIMDRMSGKDRDSFVKSLSELFYISFRVNFLNPFAEGMEENTIGNVVMMANESAHKKIGVSNLTLELIVDGSKKSRDQHPMKVSVDQLLEAFSILGPNTDSWVVKGIDSITGKVKTIDLSNLFLGCRKTVPVYLNSRTPDPVLMHKAMGEAYDLYQGEIEDQLGILKNVSEGQYDSK